MKNGKNYFSENLKVKNGVKESTNCRVRLDSGHGSILARFCKVLSGTNSDPTLPKSATLKRLCLPDADVAYNYRVSKEF